MNGKIDYTQLVASTRQVFECFPQLEETLDRLIRDEDPPMVYTAMEFLARTLIDEVRVSGCSRFTNVFDTIEVLLGSNEFDVRNLLISGFLEDLWNLSLQNGVELTKWESQLGEQSLVGWRAVLDFWQGRITGSQYNAILRGA